jgi:hypothetical protein
VLVAAVVRPGWWCAEGVGHGGGSGGDRKATVAAAVSSCLVVVLMMISLVDGITIEMNITFVK